MEIRKLARAYEALGGACEALGAGGLALLLPRSCALCGSPLLPSRRSPPWPLCEDCASSLHPLSGRRCPVCGLSLISEEGLCMRCRSVKRAFDSAYPLFSYSGAMRELISAYKKEKRRSLAPFFAALLEDAIRERWPGRVIVPVPPRPGKIRTQGWDQVEEIVSLLESRGLAVARLLARSSSGEQKKLGRGERGENARKAYGLKPGASAPAELLLLDDVVTTCATLDSCARALREGGASRIDAIVIAAD
jgi:competence protein ComFC